MLNYALLELLNRVFICLTLLYIEILGAVLFLLLIILEILVHALPVGGSLLLVLAKVIKLLTLLLELLVAVFFVILLQLLLSEFFL